MEDKKKSGKNSSNAHDLEEKLKAEERIKAKQEFIKMAGTTDFNPISNKHSKQKKTGQKSLKGQKKQNKTEAEAEREALDLESLNWDEMEFQNEEEKETLLEYVKVLNERLNLRPADVVEKYKQFISQCPEGLLTRERFTDITGQALGADVDFVTDTIYKVFDENKDNKLNFVEFMTAMETSTLSSVDDKLKWIFRMYDKNGTGKINSDELSRMFSTLFEMTGVVLEDIQMEMLVTDVMQTLDVDGSGDLDLNEFIDGCMKTPFILNLLCPEQGI